jgi:hypothetical protein
MGVGTALVRAAFETVPGEILNPIGFSPKGMGSRRAAHREICREAHEVGRPVLEENLAAYGLADRVPEEAIELEM